MGRELTLLRRRVAEGSGLVFPLLLEEEKIIHLVLHIQFLLQIFPLSLLEKSVEEGELDNLLDIGCRVVLECVQVVSEISYGFLLYYSRFAFHWSYK